MLIRRRLPSSCLLAVSCLLALSGCDDGPVLSDLDASTADAGPLPPDGGAIDASGPDPDGGAPDAGDAGPPCEDVEPTTPGDPATGAWLGQFANTGVGGNRPSVGAFAFGTDGTVYVGGNFTSAGYATASNVAAWSPTTGWSALGAGLSKPVAHLAIGADGSLFATHAQPDSFVAYRISRWDGTSWSTFADADGNIAEIEIVDGNLIAVGNFTEIGGTTANRVAYHDGTAWQTYAGLAPDRVVYAISAESLDDVCIGGQFGTLGVVAAQNVGCWNGTAWEARSFPPPPPPEEFFPQTLWSILELARDPADGTLFAGGAFELDDTGTKGGGIARWTGTEWALVGDGVMEFGPGSPGSVSGIAITASGLYVGGRFRLANASLDPQTEVNDVARWDGTSWHVMGGGVFVEGGFIGPGGRPGAVGAIAVGPDGSVYFGGGMTRADTMSVGGVVRWDGTYWRGLRASGERYDGVSGNVRALARRGTCAIYVGGEFSYAGDVRANGIASYTLEGGYEALGEGVLGAVEVIDVTRDGAVYAAGNFVDPTGIVFRNLAVWDGVAWSGFGSVGDPTDPTQTVRALAVAEGAGSAPDVVYVGGSITQAGGERVTGLAAWDGTAWSDLGAGMLGHEIPDSPGNYADPHVTALLIEPTTGDLIVAGSFRSIGAGPAALATNNIARWDGTAWHAFGDGAGDRASTVLTATLWDGRVAVAREFANDDPLLYAVWNGTAWEAIGIEQPQGTPLSIDGIGDTLFVAGNFSGAGHAAVYDGTTWSELGTGLGPEAASAVLIGRGGAFFGGEFKRGGEYGAGGIAHWRYAE